MGGGRGVLGGREGRHRLDDGKGTPGRESTMDDLIEEKQKARLECGLKTSWVAFPVTFLQIHAESCCI
jgi:malate synthase